MLIFAYMQLILRSDIDSEKWNRLVDRTSGSSFFSYSWFLDEIAEHWCVFVDEKYSKGIAIPYTIRLGVKMAYTPIFVSYLEWLGEESCDRKELLYQLRKSFHGFDLGLKTNLLDLPADEFVSQYIYPEITYALGSQAKRMLKKASKSDFKIHVTKQYAKVFGMIQTELKGKFTGMTEQSLLRLEKAMEASKLVDRLKVIEVMKEGEVLGGVICLEKEDQLYYMKGAANSTAKKNGAMYFAINAAVEYAQWKKLKFDFGGSRVEGVRNFNLHLGGKDEVYYFYREDNSPIWFRLLKRLKKLTTNG